MENNNKQKLDKNHKKEDLALRKAKLIANRRRYYIAENRESEFNTLPGHIRRAIEREANFQLDSMIKSDTFAPHLDKINSKELFEAHCEYYAHLGLQEEKVNPHNPNNLLNKLAKRDSEANKGYPGMDGNDNNKTSRHASKIDRIAAHAREAGEDYNPQSRINAMLKKQNIRS